MKDTQTQLAFIQARAAGKSYSTISRELGISKATCTAWARSLKGDIDELRQAQLEELYTAYGMQREARINALGGILKRLDAAIDAQPLEELPAGQLLDLRLKYARELKSEYRASTPAQEDATLDGLLEQIEQLYAEARAGAMSAADVKAQLGILDAKKDILYRLAQEHAREEEDPLDISRTLGHYHSKVIRHSNA